MQYGGGVSSRSAVGTRLVTKTMPHIAIGSQGCPYWGPGVSREAVFIDSHLFLLIPGGFEAIRARRLGSLWTPVAPSGRFVLPLRDDAIRQGAFCNTGRSQFAGWDGRSQGI